MGVWIYRFEQDKARKFLDKLSDKSEEIRSTCEYPGTGGHVLKVIRFDSGYNRGDWYFGFGNRTRKTYGWEKIEPKYSKDRLAKECRVLTWVDCNTLGELFW